MDSAVSKYLRWAVLVLVLVVAIGAVVVGSHDEAYAQREEADVDRARKLMEDGQSLFKQGLYNDAMLKFEEAYKTHAFSAFLYNAAFAAEKAGDLERSIARYNEYLASDPDSPYADQVKAKIEKLKEEMSQVPEPSDGGGGAGGDGGAGGGGGGDGKPAPKAPIPADEETIAQIRSLVLVESEPAGAPLTIFERIVPTAAPFNLGGNNPGWREIISHSQTPKDLSLAVGYYHVVIEKFQDYNPSETDINLAPGHVYTFKANLSQGEFLGALLLKTNVEKAKVFVDDPPPHKSAPLFRGTDTRDLNKGEHTLWIEAPGYSPVKQVFTIEQGKTTELSLDLERVDYGYLVLDGNAGHIEIEIDEKPYAAYRSGSDPTKIKLPSGKHKLMLDADGRKVFEGEIEVPKGQELPVHATLSDAYPRSKAIVLGVMAVGAGVGGVLLHLAHEDKLGGPYEDDTKQVFNVTRFVAWGASGLFLGLTIFYAVYDPNPDSLLKYDPNREFTDDEDGPKKPKPQKSATIDFIAPWFGPESGGVGMVGTF
jgi:tetratricopeptide (TPR) repeat protein